MTIDRRHPCQQVHLPFEPATAGRARLMMARDLRDAGTPGEVVEDAKLILSELVTNGLKHGKPDAENNLEVGWCVHDDRVLVCVCDAGTTRTLRPLPLQASTTSGRGLAIVDYVSDSWTLDNDKGTRITAELMIPS